MAKPKLIVISAPSGCGKTTIAQDILRRHPEMLFSVSATTRKKREGEVDGKAYFFLSKEEFEEKLRRNELVEWEQIYGNYYGTLKSEVDKTLNAGTSMLFDVDVKGALSIKKQYPDDAVLIFIEPPSIQILTERLTNRKTEDAETIKRRLDRVPMEMEMGKEFDFRVVNDQLTKAIQDVDTIICNALGKKSSTSS